MNTSHHIDINYYIGIDILKGILIILVIAGHLIQGNVEDNIIRYIIYSIHIPLFLAVSGFLINFKMLMTINLPNLMMRYFLE